MATFKSQACINARSQVDFRKNGQWIPPRKLLGAREKVRGHFLHCANVKIDSRSGGNIEVAKMLLESREESERTLR
jgi:hypothetical protein